MVVVVSYVAVTMVATMRTLVLSMMAAFSLVALMFLMLVWIVIVFMSRMCAARIYIVFYSEAFGGSSSLEQLSSLVQA